MYTNYKLNRAERLDWFFATVRFGMPSKDCRNFGICRIEVVDGKHPIQTHYAKVLAWFTKNEEGCLEFSFLKTSLTAGTKAHFFKNDTFLIKEQYIFPDSLAQQLRHKTLIIQPGLYPVEKKPMHYRVTMNVVAK